MTEKTKKKSTTKQHNTKKKTVAKKQPATKKKTTISKKNASLKKTVAPVEYSIVDQKAEYYIPDKYLSSAHQHKVKTHRNEVLLFGFLVAVILIILYFNCCVK